MMRTGSALINFPLPPWSLQRKQTSGFELRGFADVSAAWISRPSICQPRCGLTLTIVAVCVADCTPWSGQPLGLVSPVGCVAGGATFWASALACPAATIETIRATSSAQRAILLCKRHTPPPCGSVRSAVVYENYKSGVQVLQASSRTLPRLRTQQRTTYRPQINRQTRDAWADGRYA